MTKQNNKLDSAVEMVSVEFFTNELPLDEFALNLKEAVTTGLQTYLKQTDFSLLSSHTLEGKQRATSLLKYIDDAGKNRDAIIVLTATLLTFIKENLFSKNTIPKSAEYVFDQILKKNLVELPPEIQTKPLLDRSFAIANILISKLSGELNNEIKAKLLKVIECLHYDILNPELNKKGIFSSTTFKIRDLMDTDTATAKQWDACIAKIESKMQTDKAEITGEMLGVSH